ncbi:MAG: helix-turn-helix domain-containing protein [candidate division Zixibacteria bacterium]|nr:helix-turn-helix domain-containing protein [candidate division Zixibacteria bacterium]
MTDLLTIDGVADQLLLSKQTVRKLVKSGELPARMCSQSLRFLPEDVTEYLNRVKINAG